MVVKNITIKSSASSVVLIPHATRSSGGMKGGRRCVSQTGDGFRYSYLAMAVRGALFSLGLATMTLPNAVLAQSGSATSATVQAYSIPAGPMESALNEFARQTGLKIVL